MLSATDLPLRAASRLKDIMIHSLCLSLLTVSMVCLPAWAAESADHDRKIDEKDVPNAVVATMTTAAGAAKLSNFEAESENGKAFFTANFIDVQSKVKMEVTVDPDGKLIEVAKEEDEDEGLAKENEPEKTDKVTGDTVQTVPENDAPKK